MSCILGQWESCIQNSMTILTRGMKPDSTKNNAQWEEIVIFQEPTKHSKTKLLYLRKSTFLYFLGVEK